MKKPRYCSTSLRTSGSTSIPDIQRFRFHDMLECWTSNSSAMAPGEDSRRKSRSGSRTSPEAMGVVPRRSKHPALDGEASMSRSSCRCISWARAALTLCISVSILATDRAWAIRPSRMLITTTKSHLQSRRHWDMRRSAIVKAWAAVWWPMQFTPPQGRTVLAKWSKRDIAQTYGTFSWSTRQTSSRKRQKFARSTPNVAQSPQAAIQQLT
mmetsp:Transcript_64110/g.139464  ORF Transcript_64110/g.139464 Transcript_64110/m.139464 type:complete len:211 (-) Transcript_64110:358-990(-)